MNRFKRFGISALARWTGLVQQAGVAVLVVVFALAFFAVRYTAANLSMNTDTEHMLSEELIWRKLDQEYESTSRSTTTISSSSWKPLRRTRPGTPRPCSTSA